MKPLLKPLSNFLKFSLLRSGVQLERRPIEGFAEDSWGTDQSELGIAERGAGILTGAQTFIKLVHQLWRGIVADFPERGDHIVRTSAQKSPRKTNQTFASVSARTSTIAGGNGDEIGVERTRDDLVA